MDPNAVSETLGAQAPVAIPELIPVFARYEGLTLPDLQTARAEAEARFREWARDPKNAERPIKEGDSYLDRIALDSLIERRLFAE